jgi:hypothetical protein
MVDGHDKTGSHLLHQTWSKLRSQTLSFLNYVTAAAASPKNLNSKNHYHDHRFSSFRGREQRFVIA